MDPYQSPDIQDSAVIAAMARRLEERGENQDFRRFIDRYIEKIDGSRVQHVLDLGCGTGVVTRRLRALLPVEVKVTGSDISQKLLDIAMKSSEENIHWQHSSGDLLEFKEGSIDVVVLHTVLSHVSDPIALLREVKRVLSKNGQCIIFDADYASTTFAMNDFDEGKKIDLKLFGAIVHNLDVCRKMPRLFKEAGFRLEHHESYVISEAGKGDFWLSSVRGFESLIPALKILPIEQGEAWVHEMLNSHKDGTFFASGNYYTYIGRK